MPAASTSHKTTVHSTSHRVRCASLRRCRRLSKRFFHKYLKLLLRPLFYTTRRRRNQFEGGDVATSTNRNWEFSATTSPRTSVAYSADDNWRRSCDSESSIHEAVLHCKRTQGNFSFFSFSFNFLLLLNITFNACLWRLFGIYFRKINNTRDWKLLMEKTWQKYEWWFIPFFSFCIIITKYDSQICLL